MSRSIVVRVVNVIKKPVGLGRYITVESPGHQRQGTASNQGVRPCRSSHRRRRASPCITEENPNMDSLKRLMPLTSDSDRSESLRLRCRMDLKRTGPRTTHIALAKEFTARILAPALIGGFCLLYIAALVIATLRLAGVL